MSEQELEEPAQQGDARAQRMGSRYFESAFGRRYLGRFINEMTREELTQFLRRLPQEELDKLLVREEPGPTYFAVSFVVSFQNRWESFGDQNRWLIRFEDDLKYDDNFNHRPFTTAQGAIDEELHAARFPDYWHGSDYMQHRLIGPVVVQVYESDVIEPGIYSINPRVTQWEAPGYIVPDDRQLMVKGFVVRHPRDGEDLMVKIDTFAGLSALTDRYQPGMEWPAAGIITDGRLSLRAVPESPNPGYPLPGHVMTNAHTAPDTEVWERFMLDDHEW